jgi:outer membrane protein assembly factor BamB
VSRRVFTALGLCACAVLSSAACGGGQTHGNVFASDWVDDQGRSIDAVRQRLHGAQPAAGIDIAVGVAGRGDKLIGQPLGGTKWTFQHALDARPQIAGNLVLGSGGGELFALDGQTGKKLWARPIAAMPMIGAGDDGALTVVTLARAANGGSTFLAIARDGSVVRQLETDKVLGSPAVVGGIAFVPWGNQYVSVLDIATGDEPARILFREKVSRAWTQGGALWFGDVGIFRFDDNIKNASHNGATHVAIPPRELPGTPVLMTPPEDRQKVVSTARDRIRLFARPSGAEGALRLDGDRFFATYFRLVFGFEASKGNLSWVHTHPNDVIGGAAAQGALVLCDDQGKITTVDSHTGGVTGILDLGEPLKSCVVQADAVQAARAPAAVESLGTQLAAALTSRDAELVTAQRLLLREMATLEDEIATHVLVDLTSDPRTAPQIMTDARAALAGRRNGAKFMLASLDQHYDFLKDVLRPPPVGPIAQALAAMKDKSGAPALAMHLLDPASTDEDVKEVAAALAVLGDAPELPALKQFFVLYRASADSEDIEHAVVSVGQAILRLGGKDGRALVERASGDPSTVESVKTKLHGLLEVDAAAAKGAEPAKSAEPAKTAPPPKAPATKK